VTKEEILEQMKEKYDISNDKAREYLKPNEITEVKEDQCDLDGDCLTCGS